MPVPASTNPPPIARQRGRVIFLAIVGAMVAIVLLLVVLNIDRAPPQSAAAPDRDVIELIEPGALDPNQAAGDFGDIKRSLHNLGAENTWIQTAKDGKLSQQYRFASHDPNPQGLPAGWSKVVKPEIQMFLADDRVITLESETALLRAPAQRIESGRMIGSVVIRLYELEEAHAFDPQAQTPAMEARTNEAYFDNVQGEVRCDGDVDIQMPTGHLAGKGLRVLINDLEDRVERLRLEKVGAIRLAAGEEELDFAAEPTATEPSPQPAASSESPPVTPAKKSRRKSRQAPAPPAPPFYRLTLNDAVHVQQRGNADGWSARGETLAIVFSLENKTFGKFAEPQTTLNSGAVAPYTSAQPLTAMLPALAIAAQTTSASDLFQPSDDDIVITCAGPLTMVPLAPGDERPSSTQDARLQLTGRPLHLRSGPDDADIRAETFEYHTLQQRMIVKGSTAFPGVIESPLLQGSFDEFWLSRATNLGGFSGAGWLVMREEAHSSTDSSLPADASPDVRIQWQRDVDLQFAAPTPPQSNDNSNATAAKSIGKLRMAAFHGAVQVDSDEMQLRGENVTANLPPDESDGSQTHASIESILASGAVHAVSLTDDGSIDCEVLEVLFGRGPDGRSIPQRMTATGNVAAIDPDQQRVWCDTFDVEFLPGEMAQDASASSASTGRSPRLKSLLAQNNVQVLMADGARAFADQLHADAQTQVVNLTGENVMVLSDRSLIHGGKRFELHKIDNTALWHGSGQFLSFTNPLAAADPQPIAPPALDRIDFSANPMQIRANWSESMRFDGAPNDGAGALTLTGDVTGESWPSALDHNTANGRTLTMNFAHASAPETNEVSDQPSADPLALKSTRRQLKQFIITGGERDATLESRTWLKPGHSDKPRVYYIAGPTVEYDSQTLEAKVPGAGVLLVRDEWLEEQRQTASGSIPFSSKGTTSFRWSERLHMTQKPDAPGNAPGMYDIQMIGRVQVRHQALDLSVSTMVGEELHATVERLAVEDSRAQTGSAFDLGGAMELRKIHALGGVSIKSPTRTIECDDLDYDYLSGSATLTAIGPRTVLVMTAGNPNPLRAERVVWNLIEDKITATGVRGAAPPR